jgi:hypothetical protein
MPASAGAGMCPDPKETVMLSRIAMLLRLPGKGKRVWRNGRKTATVGKACLQAVLLSNLRCAGGNAAR